MDLDVFAPAIAQGDAQAFAKWLAGAEHDLRASLYSFAGSVDTESVVQEACLRLWQVAPKFVSDGRENGLLRLARTIAHNLARDEARRRKFERPATDETPQPTFEPWTPDPALRAILLRCRDKLWGKPRRALDERLQSAGAEPDEILAARLKMKLNTFLQNVTRARQQVLACLEKSGVSL